MSSTHRVSSSTRPIVLSLFRRPRALSPSLEPRPYLRLPFQAHVISTLSAFEFAQNLSDPTDSLAMCLLELILTPVEPLNSCGQSAGKDLNHAN